MWKSPIYNSIPVYNLRLINYLAAHPLFNNNLVLDPITQEPVNILAFRQKAGLSSEPGLICSIYPAFQSAENSPPSPTANGVSTIYKEYQIGKNGIEVFYHFIVEFSLFYEVSYDQLNSATDAGLSYLATVPMQSVTFKDQMPVSTVTKEVPFYIDPPQFVVGTYQELAMLAFYDEEYRASLNIPELRGISVLHANLPTSYNWEANTNLIISKSSMYIRLHTYINKNWRKCLDPNLKAVTVNIERKGQEEEVDKESVTVILKPTKE